MRIGAAIVSRHRNADFDRCVSLVEEQVDDVSTVVDPELNLSEARNLAASRLDTHVYAFIDSDAYPSETWAPELLAGYDEGEVAVGGPAFADYSHEVRNQLVPSGWDWLVGAGPYYDDVRHIRNTYGCNFSMRAWAYDKLGGFDESLGKGSSVPHGEEMDLARRMHEEFGCRMQYRPRASVYHRVYPQEVTFRSLLRRAYDQGYTKSVIGGDSNESEFVRNAVLSLSAWQWCLLGAAGIGALKAKIPY